jgi:hypothetical protein
MFSAVMTVTLTPKATIVSVSSGWSDIYVGPAPGVPLRRSAATARAVERTVAAPAVATSM